MTSVPERQDGEATPTIVHGRDLVVEDGVWEQDYNFLDYDFAPAPFTARAYLDEPGTVILHGAADLPFADVPAPVRHYLQYRYDQIDRLAGHGRAQWWARDE